MRKSNRQQWSLYLCSLFILLWSKPSAAIYIPGICQQELTATSDPPSDPESGPALTYDVTSAATGNVMGRLSVKLSPDRRSVTSADGEVLSSSRRNGVYNA